MLSLFYSIFFFFFNDTATTEIYTLSLHDALPSSPGCFERTAARHSGRGTASPRSRATRDRKSTRLNSSHMSISYAVFFLKKKYQRLRLRETSIIYCKQKQLLLSKNLNLINLFFF